MPKEQDKNGLKRRDFLKLVGVIGGGAAVSGCWSEPTDEIIPYVIHPDNVIPGIPNWYASTCTECPAGCGVMIKNMDGRAIKIEGNPESPINSGSLCARGQASLQGQYNPDRFRSPLYKNEVGKLEPISWEAAENKFVEILNKLIEQGKASKIVFLTNNISGSLDSLITDWLAAIGGGKHMAYEPISYESLKEANRITFGIDKVPSYNIENADFILSFGADFLETWLSPVGYTKQFSKMHGFDHNKMGKFVYVSPRSSLTGANADSWIQLRPGTEMTLALGLVREIIDLGLSSVPETGQIRSLVSRYNLETVSEKTDIPADKIEEIAKEFARSKTSLALGGSVSAASDGSTQTLAAINLLNFVAGNIGKTVNFNSSQSIGGVAAYKEIESLVQSMNGGDVELLITYDTNPAYSLPKTLGFDKAIEKVPHVVSFSSYPDETTAFAELVLPDSTSIEKWGDYFPADGIYGLIQPVMNPIFNTKPTGDVILSASAKLGLSSSKLAYKNYLEYLKSSWKKIHGANQPLKLFDEFWKESLKNGGYYTERSASGVALSGEVFSLKFTDPKFENASGDLYFVTYPSLSLYDGRGANRPWLQELPEPLTTSVWDSWAEVHPDTASSLGISEGDYINLETPNGAIKTQAFVFKGIRPDTIAVAIGQGHTKIGQFGNDKGVNILDILPNKKDELSGAFAWLSTKVDVSKSGDSAKLVKVQHTFSQEDRHIAQSTTLKQALHPESHNGNGHGKEQGHHEKLNMYPEREYQDNKWGMSIDLSKCVGCGSCVTACNAENNVSFVGKEQVSRGRYMGWIRIERFFEEGDDFQTKFIPMLCQHCDNAPCEPVCPVYATYNNYEGLNVMVYNRCVGTRYCANNCSYKVRRFNWYDYKLPEPLHLQLNPDVTVREKGVMEKCTFCSQRIIAAKDKARDENRKIVDGDVKPACVQTCPAEAITFGNMKDHSSEVYAKSLDSRSYHVLEELNTLPSINYLKKVERDKA
jgi:molybdopterin-containing oxidoreductase family iron-sulfur binding subunit